MPFSRGDVVLVRFPDSNLRTAKRRPAIVVQRSDLRTGLPQIILAMISSNPVRAVTRVAFPSARLHPKGRKWAYGPTRS